MACSRAKQSRRLDLQHVLRERGRVAYSDCGDAEGHVLELLVHQLLDLGLREREVEPHARLPHARLHHEVAPLLQQFQLEVGPEAVLVEGDLARQTVGRTVPHVPHVVDDPLAVPPLAPSLHAVDRHRVEAAHATEVVERLGQDVNGVVHEDVVRLSA